MSPGGPYRPTWSPSIDEEELWLSLDWALEAALVDRALACLMLVHVFHDAADFPDVREAASAALDALFQVNT